MLELNPENVDDWISAAFAYVISEQLSTGWPGAGSARIWKRSSLSYCSLRIASSETYRAPTSVMYSAPSSVSITILVLSRRLGRVSSVAHVRKPVLSTSRMELSVIRVRIIA